MSTGRRDRGEVTATVLMVPVVLMAVLLVVQVGLAYYARTVLAGAAQDGASSAARFESSPAAGESLANELIAESGASMLTDWSTVGYQSGDLMVVDAQGSVVRLFPFFPTTIRASGAAEIEQFRGQGEP